MDKASLQTQDCEKKWHVYTKIFYFRRDRIVIIRDRNSFQTLPCCPRKVLELTNV